MAEAKALTAIEADRRSEEVRVRNDDQAPQAPDEITVILEHDEEGRGALFGKLTLGGHETYRIEAEGVSTDGKTIQALGFPFFLDPGERRVFIEHWAPSQEQPSIATILLKFWPPVEGDDTDVWDCPCGQPTADRIAEWEDSRPLDETHQRRFQSSAQAGRVTG